MLVDGLLLGVVIGWLTGGRLANVHATRLRYETLFIVCMAVQMLAPRLIAAWLPGVPVLWVAWLAPAVASAVIAGLNWRIPGMPLVVAGLTLNIVVVLLNSGMPVLSSSAVIFGLDAESARAAVEASWLHVVVSGSTRLLILADVIPIPGPSWHRGLVSLGDVLLSAGIGCVVFVAMHNKADRYFPSV